MSSLSIWQNLFLLELSILINCGCDSFTCAFDVLRMNSNLSLLVTDMYISSSYLVICWCHSQFAYSKQSEIGCAENCPVEIFKIGLCIKQTRNLFKDQDKHSSLNWQLESDPLIVQVACLCK